MKKIKRISVLMLSLLLALSMAGCKPKEMPMEFDMAALAALEVTVGESIAVDLPLPLEEATGMVTEPSAGIEAVYEAPTLTIKGLTAGPANLTVTFSAKKYADGALALSINVVEPKPEPEPTTASSDSQLRLMLISDLLGINTVVPGGTADLSLTVGDQSELLIYAKEQGLTVTATPAEPVFIEAAVTDSGVVVKALTEGSSTLIITAAKEGFADASITCNVTVKPAPKPASGTPPPVLPEGTPLPAASGSADAAPKSVSEPEPPPTNPDYAALMTEIIKETNARRAEMGLAALTEDKTLNAAAELRATETATEQSHTRPDGTECHTVFAEFGRGPFDATGENLAGNSEVETGAQVVQRWMDSPPHKEAILLSQFHSIGVGVYYDGEVYRYCQLFAGAKLK